GAGLAGLHLCEHRQVADALEVARGPVEGGMAVLAKRHFSSFLIWGHVRVFSTCPFVSHARRACATPISTWWSARSSCASVLTAILTPASPARRACVSRRSSRFGCELISRNVPVLTAFSPTGSPSTS